jgi:multidrug resistance efflux pump
LGQGTVNPTAARDQPSPGIGQLWYSLSTRNIQTTDDAYTEGRAITIAPGVSGNVVRLAVSDNKHVAAGDLLVQINPRDDSAARDRAEGTVSPSAKLR